MQKKHNSFAQTLSYGDLVPDCGNFIADKLAQHKTGNSIANAQLA